MKFYCLLSFFICAFLSINGQIIKNPNYGEKSHPTLEITSIEFNDKETIFTLTIENRIKQGWFCADKNIIIQAIGEEIQLKSLKTENIPTCPDNHKFSTVGEKLTFKIFFPIIDKSAKYFNLIEQCDNSCFYFHGIILSENFNLLIEEAYQLYEAGKHGMAAVKFKQIIEKYPEYPYGFLYINLINIYNKLSMPDEADIWQKKLQESDCIDKTTLID